jgi:hypothetical protein
MNEKNTNTSQRFIIFSFDEDSNGNADRNNINIHFKYYSKIQMEMRFKDWDDHEMSEHIEGLFNKTPQYEEAHCYRLNAQNVDIASEVLEPKEDNNNWVEIHKDSRKIIKEYAINFLEERVNIDFDLSRKNGVFSLDNDDKNYRLTPRKNNNLNEFKVTKIPTKTKNKKQSRGIFSSFGF